MFLRHIGLNLKELSSISISFLTLIDSMYLSERLEKGSSAWLHPSHTRSKEQTLRLSGMAKPWSIGTSFLTLLPVFLSIFVFTNMLHSLRSKLRILTSKIAILWISSLENRSVEKSSMQPSLSTNCQREPNFRPMCCSQASLTETLSLISSDTPQWLAIPLAVVLAVEA